jgi:hypothetical protein
MTIPKFSIKTYIAPIIALVLGLGASAFTYMSVSSAQDSLDKATAALSAAKGSVTRIQGNLTDLSDKSFDASMELLRCQLSSAIDYCPAEEALVTVTKADVDEETEKLTTSRELRDSAKAAVLPASEALESANQTLTFVLFGSAIATIGAFGFVLFLSGSKKKKS